MKNILKAFLRISEVGLLDKRVLLDILFIDLVENVINIKLNCLL